jgi:hypothetical protein
VDVATIVSGTKVNNVKICDISGKQIINSDGKSDSTDGKTQVDMSKLTTGTYILSIETDSGTQSVKVIKK